MEYSYPEPQDVGITIPKHLMRDRFCAGFRHALQGENLLKREHLRLSFREGFRAGKLYLREVRRTRGILNFPRLGRIRLASIC